MRVKTASSITCERCAKSFSSESKLNRHRKEVHNNSSRSRIRCPLCSLTFSRKENYRQHVNNSNLHLQCKLCQSGVVYRTQSDLKNHMEQEHSSGSFSLIKPSSRQRSISVKNNAFSTLASSSTSAKNKREFSSSELDILPMQDPNSVTESVLEEYPTVYHEMIEESWAWIKTRHVKRAVSPTFNLRFPAGRLSADEIKSFLHNIHQVVSKSYKINIAFGYIYRTVKVYDEFQGLERETEDTVSDPKYFLPQRPSATNPGFLSEPWTVTESSHIEDLIRRIVEDDIMEHLNLTRPSTKYIVELVTNLMVYVHLLEQPAIGCCSEDPLPKYLTEKKSVTTLWYRNSSRKERWQQPRCLFRCVALHILKNDRGGGKIPCSSLEMKTEELFQQYCQKNQLHPNIFDARISLSDLGKAESAFNIKIFVYELRPRTEPLNGAESDTEEEDPPAQPTGSELDAILLRKPAEQLFEESFGTLHLDVCRDHFSLITDIAVYSNTYMCSELGCRRIFNSRKGCLQHQTSCSDKSTRKKRKIKCRGGGYETGKTLYDELLTLCGISVPEAKRFTDQFACWDCEAYRNSITSEQDRKHGHGTEFVGELVLASVSVCSSVEGYERPMFFLSTGNPQGLCDDVVEYLLEISSKVAELLRAKFSPELTTLRMKIEEETDSSLRRRMEKLERKFHTRVQQLFIFGWSSSRFDMLLLRKYLFPSFAKQGVQIEKILKKGNSYLLLSTNRLVFKDMMCLVSPTASYANWLKSLGICGDSAKSVFPFSWFDSLEKLKEKKLPDRYYWTNDLKNKPLTDAEWGEVQRVWTEQGMANMAEYLEFYNNRDVMGFVTGVQMQREFWKQEGICLISEGVSLSGLALRLFDRYLPSDIYFALPQQSDYRFIRLLRKSVCGGLSQVFRRLHVSGITRIRNGPHLCRSVLGLDFNSLYLTELGMKMPHGVSFEWAPAPDKTGSIIYQRRCVLPNSVSLGEMEWLTYESWKTGRRISHYLSSKQQFRIPNSQMRADGYLPGNPGTVYEYDGCYFHAHPIGDPTCTYASSVEESDPESMRRWNLTNYKLEMIAERSYNVIKMPECVWDWKRKHDPEISRYLTEEFYPDFFHKRNGKMTQSQLLSCIEREEIFGICMVDIETPIHLRKKFESMQPLILSRIVDRNDLGPLMAQYCEENNTLRKPRRVLAQAYSARNLLLITPLLSWYINQGLVVKRVHWLREFHGKRIFEGLVNKVTKLRKAADSDPSLALQGESWKLAGNSMYGKMLENSANHLNVSVMTEEGLRKAVNKPNFQGSDELTEDWFEVATSRRQSTEDKPLLQACFILQYSKLRLLRFYYDFLDRFLDESKWEPCICDTDSLYLALAAESIDDLLKKDANPQAYRRAKQKFMVAKPEDKRTPGLMKIEFKGSGIIALSPKTYYCFVTPQKDVKTLSDMEEKRITDKHSCKGTQKELNQLNETYYYSVLTTQQKHYIENRGLWFKEGRFVQYSQRKTGLPYLITKKWTEEDGVTLSPLPEPSGGVDALIDHSESEEDSPI